MLARVASFIFYYPNMANTYTQLHIQIVFAVKYRSALINPNWKEHLHKYITGIIQSNGHKMLQINSMPDHAHILLGMRPTQSISSLVQHVKSESTKLINNEKISHFPFAWQEGFGAFSYSKSQVPEVIRYIQNQEIQHRKESFLREYIRMLKSSDILFDEKYIFHMPA
ncbi:MAG: IS200/IS605 family transposase [Chitinophagaceae bacterium]